MQSPMASTTRLGNTICVMGLLGLVSDEALAAEAKHIERSEKISPAENRK